MPEAHASIRIAADLRNLASIRHFVEATARSYRVDDDAIGDVLQAVDESATNIIEHGYHGQAGHIEVEMFREDNRLIVCLRDAAPPFDPTQVPMPNLSLPLEERPLGGMGIFLTRRLTDGVTYRLTALGENELTLVKHVAS